MPKNKLDWVTQATHRFLWIIYKSSSHQITKDALSPLLFKFSYSQGWTVGITERSQLIPLNRGQQNHNLRLPLQPPVITRTDSQDYRRR